jgi:tight adherence protein B
VAGLVIAVLGTSVVPLFLGAAGMPLLRRVRRADEARRARERRGEAVIALCGALSGEVRAGRQPGEALRRAAHDSGGLGEAQAVVLAAARFGGDVPGALTDAARQPGADGLVGLAACWRVAVDRGAGLAAGLDRLPVLGLLLGTALGADPLHVLLHSGPGLGCLLVGGVLEAVGLWWALRIVRGAEAT